MREGERARVKGEGECSVGFYKEGEGEAPRRRGRERSAASKPLMPAITTTE
jgi:hypothetical protein